MDWNLYWAKAQGVERPQGIYERVAKFYRDQIISRSAARSLSRYFADEGGRRYLHAGCGSGGSDRRISLWRPQFHFLDIAPTALELHRRQPIGLKRHYSGGDIFRLPYRDGSMDGIFNFGVMEHFHEEEIRRILAEFRRVLKPGGRVLLFWPPDFGLSVIALTGFLSAVNRFRKTPLNLYPDEVCRIPSFRWARELMAHERFKVLDLGFGPGDFFTYVAVAAEKTQANGNGDS